MYIVAICRFGKYGPSLGKCMRAETWDEAVTLGVDLVLENTENGIDDFGITLKELKNELNDHADFPDPIHNDWSVCIGTLSN